MKQEYDVTVVTIAGCTVMKLVTLYQYERLSVFKFQIQDVNWVDFKIL